MTSLSSLSSLCLFLLLLLFLVFFSLSSLGFLLSERNSGASPVIFSFLKSDFDLCPVRNRAGPNVCRGTLCWCWHWFSGCENIKSGVTFHTESSFHMKISGLGGICHMSDVREEKISGRGHISCPGHCRPGASPAGTWARRGSDCVRPESWELMRTFCEVCEHFGGEALSW